MCRLWRVYWLGFVGYLLLNISVVSAASTDNLILTDQKAKFSASAVVEYFEDSSRQLTFEQVTSQSTDLAFKQNTQKLLNFGRSNSAWWVRFRIQNQADAAWYLLLDSALGGDLDLYIFPQDTHNLPTTRSTSLYAKPVPDYLRPAWSLNLPPNQTFQVYLRVTNENYVLALPISLVSADAFVGYSVSTYRFISFIYAGMIILGLYQLFMFLVLREVNYLLLAIFIFAAMLTIHRTNPIFPGLEFLSHTGSYFYLTPFLSTIAALAEFTRRVLDVKNYSTKLNRLYECLAGAAIILVFLVGLIPIAPVLPIILTVILLVLSVISSHYIARQGHRIARYFSWIYWVPVSLHLPVMLMLLFKAEQWQASIDTFTSIGTLVFLLLLAVLQAERVRILREQMKQIEAASEAKEEFLATMSHELRTPIHAIVGLSTLLKLSSLDSKQQLYLQRLDSATEHVMQLISNMLDYAKLTNYRFQLKPEPCHLNLVVNSTLPLIQQQAQQKGLTFKFESSGDLAANLLLDRTCLTQVLLNLLSNAVKYTPEGWVKLAIQVDLPVHQQQLVHFTVSDTGIGLPEEHLAYLFEPFTQLAPKSAHKGVGLGLAISQRLVAAMGAELKVNSQLSQGTEISFAVSFPLALKVGPSASSFCPLTQGLRLLIADNSELNHPETSALLRQLGADVQVVPNGQDGILCLQEEDVDMVLVDMTLPELGGLELSRWVRHSGRNPKLPIVALTSTTVKDIEPACRDIGINAYLCKPLDSQSLSAALNRVLAA